MRILVFPLPVLAAVIAAIDTRQGRDIVVGGQRFLLFYSGVFALVALTATVGAGLLAAGKIALSPGRRVAAQAVHRAISLVALMMLATHITLEIMAHRARPADAFVPFLAHGRTFYLGLGTIAADLIVVIIATGIIRARFAGGPAPWAWRALHVTAYLAWPFAILHGLMAGRQPKPYVDWSYGACVAAAALLLVVRRVVTLRGHDTAPQPVPAQPWRESLATVPPMALSDRPWHPAHVPAAASRAPGKPRHSAVAPVPAPRSADSPGFPASGQSWQPTTWTPRDADTESQQPPPESWQPDLADRRPWDAGLIGDPALDGPWWPDLPTDPFGAVRITDLAGHPAPGGARQSAPPSPRDADLGGFPAPAEAWRHDLPTDPFEVVPDVDVAGYVPSGEAWQPDGAIEGRLVPDQVWRAGFASGPAVRADSAAGGRAGGAGELAAPAGTYLSAPVRPARAGRVGSHRAVSRGAHRVGEPARPHPERWLPGDDRP